MSSLITMPVRAVRGTYLRMQLTRGATKIADLSMDDILSTDIEWVLGFMEAGNTPRDKTGAILDPDYTCPAEARRLAYHLAKLSRHFMPSLSTVERTALMAADGSPQDDLNRLVADRLFKGDIDDAQMYATLAQGACKGRMPLVSTYKYLIATLEAADPNRIASFAPDFLRNGTKKSAIVERANRHVAWCIANVDTLEGEKPANVTYLHTQNDQAANG